MDLIASSGWYADTDCTMRVDIGTNGLPANGVNTDLELLRRKKLLC